MGEYGNCPNCGAELVKKDGRKGPFLSCSNFPKCRFSMDYKPENTGKDLSNMKNCPNCGSPLVKKNGRFGAFLSCTNYPKCRFSMNYNPKNNEKDLNSTDKCPRCGAKLEKRNGRNGPFLGCSNFPKCRYTRDYTPTNINVETINSSKKEPFSFQDEKYQSKVKRAREFIFKNMNMDLKKFLALKNWDEDISLCMDIFDDNVTFEDEKYVESMLGHAKHRRDKRSSLEYACDLMVGWIIEDCVVDILNGIGYSTSLNGADKNRKLLLDPTTDSDLKISINGDEILIESVNDFTGYWKKTKHVPLRDKKYLHLKKEKSLLFGIDYVNNLFFILNVPEREANYIKYHRPFSKPAYAILITDDDFYNLNEVESVFSKVLTEY